MSWVAIWLARAATGLGLLVAVFFAGRREAGKAAAEKALDDYADTRTRIDNALDDDLDAGAARQRLRRRADRERAVRRPADPDE